MAQYPPPTETLPIFDASKFMHDTTALTRTEADLLYVHYSTAQGEVIFPSIRVNGDTNTDTVTAVNIEAKDTITCTTLKYDILDPPVGGGSTGTLAQVLTTGNDATGLNMINIGNLTGANIHATTNLRGANINSDDWVICENIACGQGTFNTVSVKPSTGAIINITATSATNLNVSQNITCPEIISTTLNCSTIATVGTLKYTTLDPPILPGGVSTLTEVLTAGDNAGGLSINNLSTIVVTTKAGIESLDVGDITILPSVGTGILITAPSAGNISIPANITASGMQINTRAFVADYEFAVYPTGTNTTSNFILGSNNNNNYNLFQYNPVGGTNNELQLQYQENSIQPSTTKTLMTVLPSGDIQLGYLQSATPNVQIAGTAGLGRVYDTIYNPPSAQSNPLTGNFQTTITPTWQFEANTPRTMLRIMLNQLEPANPSYSSYNVELNISAMQFVMNFTGETGTVSNFLFYLGSEDAQVYDNEFQTGYSFNTPASTNTPYSSTIDITNNNIPLSINSITPITELFLICLLTPVPGRISNYKATIPSFVVSGIVKAYVSNIIVPLVVYPSS